ncbi:flagellar basal body-associated protein FliL [Pseudalkalibacillus salsuginis]|uniref:flagellar basal body-associated protein FliL n=1 Tax=Pseudalkalibacillus salsuginis TaxID=2910972 RepID=UPI001F1729CA|nr:flagellar basal body-associated protein FliL [Pseudalkalibacillus salsuginis]MCF6410575.1 flagellar basal body-associated protein FliL [Pseudalkalibacillus salsuginis]
MKNNLVKTMLVMITAITIVAVAGVVLYMNLISKDDVKASGELSASELVELSVDTDQIMTNLEDKGFAKMTFRIQVDNSKAKQELEKRMFQVKNSIIYQLSGTKSQELQGPEGIENLESSLQKTINEFLDSGEVVQVFTTEKVVQ